MGILQSNRHRSKRGAQVWGSGWRRRPALGYNGPERSALSRLSVRSCVLGLALAACHPGLPSGDKPSTDGTDDDPATTDTDVLPDDTDPAPPCALPEAEPNNDAGSANPLPLEVQACGSFSSAPDADFWSFATTEEGWLAVDLDGYRLGSLAHLSMTLSSTSGLSVGLNYWQDIPEVHFKMPVGADAFTVFVRQQVGAGGGAGGGEDFFYEIMASSVKPPVSWDVDEVANETAAGAQSLSVGLTPADGVAVFGALSDAQDQDWFLIEVPIGRHAVVLDVDAAEFGSAGNFELQRADAGGAVVESVSSGQLGWEPDPYLVRHTTEVETIRVRVVDESRLTGPQAWYVLRVKVVEE